MSALDNLSPEGCEGDVGHLHVLLAEGNADDGDIEQQPEEPAFSLPKLERNHASFERLFVNKLENVGILHGFVKTSINPSLAFCVAIVSFHPHPRNYHPTPSP